MPYRDRAHVQLWVGEYLRALPSAEGRIGVLDEGFDPASEACIVTFALNSADTLTYLQATLEGEVPVWRAVFEGRAESFSLDAVGLESLTKDLTDLGALCFWLQRCTDDAMRARRPSDNN